LTPCPNGHLMTVYFSSRHAAIAQRFFFFAPRISL
jgi:hypothetical protein